MTTRPPFHGSYRLSRPIPVPIGDVWAALSDVEVRRRWSRVPSDTGTGTYQLDFREGGFEHASGRLTIMDRIELVQYSAQFLEIVAGERIVHSYEVVLDGLRRSISLVTTELSGDDAASVLTITEQYVLLVYYSDGATDAKHMESGRDLQLNGLERVLTA